MNLYKLVYVESLTLIPFSSIATKTLLLKRARKSIHFHKRTIYLILEFSPLKISIRDIYIKILIISFLFPVTWIAVCKCEQTKNQLFVPFNLKQIINYYPFLLPDLHTFFFKQKLVGMNIYDLIRLLPKLSYFLC